MGKKIQNIHNLIYIIYKKIVFKKNFQNTHNLIYKNKQLQLGDNHLTQPLTQSHNVLRTWLTYTIHTLRTHFLHFHEHPHCPQTETNTSQKQIL